MDSCDVPSPSSSGERKSRREQMMAERRKFLAEMRRKKASAGAGATASDDPFAGGMLQERAPEICSEFVRIEDHYELREELGRGQFGVVYDGVERKTGNSYAVKVLSKRVCSPQMDAAIKSMREEFGILRELNHPGVVRLHELLESEINFYLVMEKISGGELWDHIVEHGGYNERIAAGLFRQLVECIQYLHAKGICHRDLKPQNILVQEAVKDLENAHIKITDFGVSTLLPESGAAMREMTGTPQYMAPEVVRLGKYDEEVNLGDYDETTRGVYHLCVDMWSAGCILYVLLCGFLPFDDPDESHLVEKICTASYTFPEDKVTVSAQARDLIGHLLTANPDERYTASEVLAHPWMHEASAEWSLAKTVKNMETFTRRRLRAAVNAVMAANRFQRLLGLGGGDASSSVSSSTVPPAM